MKKYFADEVNKTIEKITEFQKKKNPKMDSVNDHMRETVCNTDSILSLCLLSDSHYTEEGNWQDTAENIKEVLGCVPMNGIVHLGDFTDGIEKKEKTIGYVKRMLDDLKKNQCPVYITLGNHDANFLKGNPERLSLEEQLELFGLGQAYYIKDFAEQKLRCLFLQSYDTEVPVRYGFSDEELEWVKWVLEETPEYYKVLVFAHAAPLPHLDYWSRLIRNGKELVQILEDYNTKENQQILAYIHGHTHAEHIYYGCSFPIISIGCNKCERLPDKRIPKGAYVFDRECGTVSQDLWDVLLVDVNEQQVKFVRFGAGEDRIVDCHKRNSVWQKELAKKRKERQTKIWAHRGSSGFAPENTIPAFEIAKALDVDGIELDVQMTKDGELVVIHDETIDRTSDGSGWIADYTLEELRQFNFAINKPIFGFVTIPTLREVYELFQDTDYIINVELKINAVVYDETDADVSDSNIRSFEYVMRNDSVISDKRQQNACCIEERIHALTEEMKMTKQVIYSSFNHAAIKKMQKYVTDEQTAFLLSDGWIDVCDYGLQHQIQALHPPKTYLGLEQLIQNCHQKGIKVHVWDVNDEKAALQLKKWGADSVITNHPGKLRDIF